MTKRERSPLAGQAVKVKKNVQILGCQTVLVVDWAYNACENITPAFIEVFQNRIGSEIFSRKDMLPPLYDVLLVLYGGTSAALVHIDELDVPASEQPGKSEPTMMQAAKEFREAWIDKVPKGHALILIAADEEGADGCLVGLGSALIHAIECSVARDLTAAGIFQQGVAKGTFHQ